MIEIGAGFQPAPISIIPSIPARSRAGIEPKDDFYIALIGIGLNGVLHKVGKVALRLGYQMAQFHFHYRSASVLA